MVNTRDHVNIERCIFVVVEGEYVFLCTECSCSVLKPVRLLNSVFCDRILRKIDNNFKTKGGKRKIQTT